MQKLFPGRIGPVAVPHHFPADRPLRIQEVCFRELERPESRRDLSSRIQTNRDLEAGRSKELLDLLRLRIVDTDGQEEKLF